MRIGPQKMDWKRERESAKGCQEPDAILLVATEEKASQMPDRAGVHVFREVASLSTEYPGVKSHRRSRHRGPSTKTFRLRRLVWLEEEEGGRDAL
ncbi:hypothetical protein EYF80_033035 [Liparis tanakae]|uniref:Uncharacterized protein n=1 Tax=Liparis tanakae TaxID=230148 RepID=A0A4Z2GT50_9TELE|nr:hypothetical protein EYF80_033035 [Liparis tanakae]